VHNAIRASKDSSMKATIRVHWSPPRYKVAFKGRGDFPKTLAGRAGAFAGSKRFVEQQPCKLGIKRFDCATARCTLRVTSEAKGEYQSLDAVGRSRCCRIKSRCRSNVRSIPRESGTTRLARVSHTFTPLWHRHNARERAYSRGAFSRGR